MTVVNEDFQIAGVREPLPTSLVNPLLLDSDAVLYYALDFWTFVINTYPGPRLLTAAAQVMKTSTGAPVIPTAIAQAYPDDPVPYLQENQLRFPCLGVYRKEATYKKHSAGWYDDRCAFDLLYILPPLNAGQAEAILPILRAVEMAIRQKTVQSFDPAYTPPGGALGQSPWGLAFASVEEIGFEKGTRGRFPGGGNMEFPFLLMSGYVLERDMYVPGPKFAGADVAVSLLAPDGTTLPNLVQVATQQAPTITSVSPASGSMAGGVPVTLTGTLFLYGPPVVYFGNQLATNVVWVNATTVTCTTPAMSGAGTIGVSLVNRDGQTASASFTVTSP